MLSRCRIDRIPWNITGGQLHLPLSSQQERLSHLTNSRNCFQSYNIAPIVYELNHSSHREGAEFSKMPGLLSFWPVMSTNTGASGKMQIHISKKEKSSLDRPSHTKFRSMGAKVSPLAFVESDTPLENSFDRTKQVSEPLNDIVKAKLCHSELSSPVSGRR